MRRVAIHQPNYLPWIGYFKKMSLCDVFVILDNVQFSKDSYTQRTEVRTRKGWMWLTIPIQKEEHFKLIKDVSLPKNNKWRKKHWLSIHSNYAKTKHFEDFNNFFKDVYLDYGIDTLQDFNEKFIIYMSDIFDIHPEIVRASELNIESELKKSDLLIEIIKNIGGDVYISGTGGENYIEEEKFKKEGIGVDYFKFQPFVYPQRWAGFEPYMSAIDVLFNMGKDGIESDYSES